MVERDEAVLRLRRLWDDHRHVPFPAADRGHPQVAELALYESWLGGMVEAALPAGRLLPAHALMLRQRRAEGNGGLWAVAAERGEPVRSYVARLLAIEDLLSQMPSS